MGYILAVTHFVMKYTHVSRHFGVYNRIRNFCFGENCFENVFSEIYNKNPPKIVNTLMVFSLFFLVFVFFSKSSFVDT